jgi:peptide methionine sulfoxide reductase MsrA
VRQGKPVLVLFQEVPGCSGTQEFGKEILSNPLMVEAIESEFIPMLIYNNRVGRDAELLARYHEPAWNYQVIRFLDGSGKDIIPRRDRIWTLGAVARRMGKALKKTGNNVPLYLQGLALENDNPEIKAATFAMFCFWTGEMNLGGLEGVVNTEAGFYGGREVTRVWYDEGLISFGELIRKAAENDFTNAVYVQTDKEREKLNGITELRIQTYLFDIQQYRKADISDQKKQIQGSLFMHLDLTRFQLTKVNAFAHKNREKALEHLSPRQTARFRMLSQR